MSNEDRIKDIVTVTEARIRHSMLQATVEAEHAQHSATEAIRALASTPPAPLHIGKEPAHVVALTLRDPAKGSGHRTESGRLCYVTFDFNNGFSGARLRDPTFNEHGGYNDAGPFKLGKNYLAVTTFYELPDEKP